MVKVATYFAMTLGAFVFWQTMDKVHVWIALHQDEKVTSFYSPIQSQKFVVSDDQFWNSIRVQHQNPKQ